MPKKDPLNQKIKEAKASGRYMVAVFHVVEDGAKKDTHLWRLTHNFPEAMFATAVNLLRTNLDDAKGKK